MSSSLVVKDAFPRRDFTSITQVGLKAYNLAIAYQPAIDASLPGALAALAKDVDALSVVIPGAVQAHHEATAATAAQDAIVRQGHAQVRAIRQVVRKSGAAKDVQRAYGVGQRTSSRQVHHVEAALQQVVDRAAAAPQEAAGFGLTKADIAAMSGFIAALSDADRTQEKKRAGAPLSTKERNLVANRIIQTAAVIAGTGMRAFVQNPAAYASFEALMASTRLPRSSAGAAKGKAKGKAGAAGEPPSDTAATLAGG